jgi:hypothetical protein
MPESWSVAGAPRIRTRYEYLLTDKGRELVPVML